MIPSNIRQKVIIRDGIKCRKCGFDLLGYYSFDVHHIIPFATCQEHKIDNLITLCKFCHKHAHNEPDLNKWLNSDLFSLEEPCDSEINSLFRDNRIGLWYGIFCSCLYGKDRKNIISYKEFLVKRKGNNIRRII